jgi:multiple sugar transport system permease protein
MRFLHRLLIYMLLVLGAITCLIPLLWMVSTGLKPVDQTMSMPPTWIPYRFYVEKDGALTEIQKGDLDKYPNAKIVRKIAPRWDNFASAIKYMKYFPLYLKNTLILCILTVVGTVTSSALTAYGFARVDWRGRDKVFLVALATMMVPFPVVMVPMYCLFRWLGWIGTLKPLWVGSFFAGAFNVFLLRQFFMGIPKELEESAMLDGCSRWGCFWRIMLPLSKPALAVVALFHCLAVWNDLVGPLIYLSRKSQFTLALGLQFLQAKSGDTPWNQLMAASTLTVLPVLVLFLLAQRTFIRGIATTGLKG